MKLLFEKISLRHIDIIFSWLAEPFVREFWDNTQAHKDDIMNFVEGRKTPSNYGSGKYVYWLTSFDNIPFAMFMTFQESYRDSIEQEKIACLSRTGNTYSLDYMIGNSNFLGKGYGAKTLIKFIDYFRKNIDPKADTFLIDPASDNPRAKHVYMKAGFEHIADFIRGGDDCSTGKPHHLLIKQFIPNIRLSPATIADYPTVQNMARFYIYDRTAYMGWECPENGLFECIDFKHYFENSDNKAFLIKILDEIAGFVLLDKMHVFEPVEWNMGEFFVLAKFQGRGVASTVARKIFQEYPGKWEVAVMPENLKAVKFWRKIISEVSRGDYREAFKTGEELTTPANPDPYAMNVFTFNTHHKTTKPKSDISIRFSQASDIPRLVEMSYQKRRSYEKAQPRFWKYAGAQAEISQAKWFEGLLTHDDHIMLTAVRHEKIAGFIIGRLMPAPEVYNPGGLTLMIDDFCLESEELWSSVGRKLIEQLKEKAKDKGAAQILIVCGAHDKPKRQFLIDNNLSIASEWYVGKIA